MKHLLLLCLFLGLTGVSCALPQRTHSILPPTNERDLCKTDRRFHYSATYGYCFRFGDEAAWTRVQSTGPHDTGIESVTSEDFFINADEQTQILFTLYVGPASETVIQSMTDNQITVIRSAQPYAIGYAVAPAAHDLQPTLAAQIPNMLHEIYFFAPDGSRQVTAP